MGNGQSTIQVRVGNGQSTIQVRVGGVCASNCSQVQHEGVGKELKGGQNDGSKQFMPNWR